MTEEVEIDQSSFRDPSGFVFRNKGRLFRQVNSFYEDDYRALMDSGLYGKLTNEGLLVTHEKVDIEPPDPDRAYKILKPKEIPFVSYPYEWCFGQLKRAALTTLEIQKIALEFDMSLKDASAYNVQFRGNNPVHIDTLSFETYHEGQPWVAYRQFCQHFLAPLALMSYKNASFNKLLRLHIDGVPLDLASSLLPLRTKVRFSLLSHIHLHARSQKKFSDRKIEGETKTMSRNSFLGLIDNLRSGISGLSWEPQETTWSNYYEGASNYSSRALENKKKIVEKFLRKTEPEEVWDLGANVGTFSRISSKSGNYTVSVDFDPACVQQNFERSLKQEEQNLLPLLVDLTNPSPGIGWKNEERKSFLQRGPTDTLLALALIHHLAIGNNAPLDKITDLFAEMCNYLIVEFVPKSDPQVKKLLAGREDVFFNYRKEGFEKSFQNEFSTLHREDIEDSQRTLYLMKKR